MLEGVGKSFSIKHEAGDSKHQYSSFFFFFFGGGELRGAGPLTPRREMVSRSLNSELVPPVFKMKMGFL